MRERTSAIFLAAAIALSVGNAAAAPYTFINIADNSGPFNFFGGPLFRGPSLNDSGTVAFVATLDTGQTGILTSSGGAPTTIVDSSCFWRWVRKIAPGRSEPAVGGAR